MTKKYQTYAEETNALAVPEQVSIAMGEIAADMREGLLALAVGAGLQVMQQLMEADVTAACGPRGKHDPDRTAIRHGTEAGSVMLGGRRVPVRRPWVRAVAAAVSCRSSLRGVQRHRAARADGDGADAGRGLDTSLPDRLGAGRR